MDISSWWEALSLLQKIHWVIALPSTLIFLIQLISTLVGGDADGFDSDSDFEGGDGDDGMNIFSIKSITSFLMFYGWSGLAAIQNGMLAWWGITLISFLIGLAMMLFTAWLFYLLIKLQESGTMKMENAIGKIGETYLSIPAKKQGEGKVQLIVQGGYKTLNAITEDAEGIVTGTFVEVIGFMGDVVIVKRKR